MSFCGPQLPQRGWGFDHDEVVIVFGGAVCTNKQTSQHTCIHTDVQRHVHTDLEADRRTDGRNDGQTDRQTDTFTCIHAYMHAHTSTLAFVYIYVQTKPSLRTNLSHEISTIPKFLKSLKSLRRSFGLVGTPKPKDLVLECLEFSGGFGGGASFLDFFAFPASLPRLSPLTHSLSLSLSLPLSLCLSCALAKPHIHVFVQYLMFSVGIWLRLKATLVETRSSPKLCSSSMRRWHKITELFNMSLPGSPGNQRLYIHAR